ncbi:MFS transporter [Virgisporangium aliadipatigenens]|uniref:MFS transporter n=1 Tax=Virgisporangium aliadipatigenens TaxID=741659 RepID=A0A8J4DTQ1_9ACTN|nr:MFS transporter [Virgisporangium aliadipatigenens]GIJ49243.1 MFS transporter [Virgisporangium aliadipatigenens]
MTAPPLPARIPVGYSLGSLATGAFGTVPGLLLLPYLTDTLGVAAAVAGFLVLAPKAWDVLLNPVAGRISDRAGVRRPFLLGGGLALAVLFAAIFAGPFRSGVPAATWVALSFLATATAFAFFQVPYVAMAAELTDDYLERTRLMTWRIAVLAIAILISGAVAPLVVDAAGGGMAGHRWMGLFVAAIIVAGVLGVYLGTAGAPVRMAGESEPSLRAQLRVASANTAFRGLLLCFVVQAAGIGTMLAGVQYFATHVLNEEKIGPTVLFACFVAPALLVMPLWRRVGQRAGKPRGMVLASVLFAASGAAMVTAPVVPPALVYALAALNGVGYAGQQVFGMAMLPDCIAYDAARTGRRQAGVFTGLWTAGETLGLALGPGLYAVVLAAFGYVSSTTGTLAQSATARTGVLLGFTVLPAVLVGGALWFLRGYDLTPTRLAGATKEAAV